MKSRVSSVLLLLILIIGAPALLPAESGEQRFQEANAAYAGNDFPKAITLYEEIVDKHGFSSAVLNNLAGSYAQTGKYGLAVLNYERALRLSPSDSDILGNLHLIREASGLFAPQRTVVQRALHGLSLNQWTILGSVGVLLLSITLLAPLCYPLSQRLQVVLSVSAIGLTLLGTVGSITLTKEWSSSVVINSSRLQISPFAAAAAAGEMQAGRKVYPKKEHGEYLYIEDETGRTGWLHKSVIVPIAVDITIKE
jgi:tetratricopeptide (TPR) repeat protein